MDQKNGHFSDHISDHFLDHFFWTTFLDHFLTPRMRGSDPTPRTGGSESTHSEGHFDTGFQPSSHRIPAFPHTGFQPSSHRIPAYLTPLSGGSDRLESGAKTGQFGGQKSTDLGVDF